MPHLTADDNVELTIQQQKKPEHKRNKLETNVRLFMMALVVLSFVFILCCGIWTHRHGNKTILRLSQPKYLYIMCCGCFVSTLSSVAPLFGRRIGCQLMVWLYGLGFVVTTSILFIKMQQMNNVIEHSLKMTSKSIKTNTMEIFKVMLIMGAGEFFLLAAWALVDPLDYKRSCFLRQKGGPYDGACLKSTGKCRSNVAAEFVTLLALWHVGCVLAGMYMCYLVRNLPSIMAEGKWVFTGFFSYLEVFIVATPVLAMVKNDYVTFTLLKSLAICLGDISTLAMIYIPKMLLVYKYEDFDRGAISAYVAKTLNESTQRDTVYETLRIKKASSSSASSSMSMNSSLSSGTGSSTGVSSGTRGSEESSAASGSYESSTADSSAS